MDVAPLVAVRRAENERFDTALAAHAAGAPLPRSLGQRSNVIRAKAREPGLVACRVRGVVPERVPAVRDDRVDAPVDRLAPGSKGPDRLERVRLQAQQAVLVEPPPLS